jgi:hypothetical protein
LLIDQVELDFAAVDEDYEADGKPQDGGDEGAESMDEG